MAQFLANVAVFYSLKTSENHTYSLPRFPGSSKLEHCEMGYVIDLSTRTHLQRTILQRHQNSSPLNPPPPLPPTFVQPLPDPKRIHYLEQGHQFQFIMTPLSCDLNLICQFPCSMAPTIKSLRVQQIRTYTFECFLESNLVSK